MADILSRLTEADGLHHKRSRFIQPLENFIALFVEHIMHAAVIDIAHAKGDGSIHSSIVQQGQQRIQAAPDGFCIVVELEQIRRLPVQKLPFARQEAAELLRQTQEEAEQLRSQTKNETDQFLLEIKTKGQAQTQKLALYTGAIAKIREDVAILANRTDDALNAFAEQFLSLRQDFEDSE